ncbi:MAG: cupin, partial [Thiotrichales bacterium]|nr:cupin [Thiotrichales bacterium]
MHDRIITDIHNVEFKPFDRYGSPVPKMSWHIISYDKTSG